MWNRQKMHGNIVEGAWALAPGVKERGAHKAINTRELLIQRKTPKARLHYVRQRSQQPIQKSSRDCIIERTEFWAFQPCLPYSKVSIALEKLRNQIMVTNSLKKPQVVGKLASLGLQLSSKDDSHSKRLFDILYLGRNGVSPMFYNKTVTNLSMYTYINL